MGSEMCIRDRKEATNKIPTAVHAAVLWPCPCSAMGFSSMCRCVVDVVRPALTSLCQRQSDAGARMASRLARGILAAGDLVPFHLASATEVAGRAVRGRPRRLTRDGRVVLAREPVPAAGTDQGAEPTEAHDERARQCNPCPDPRMSVRDDAPAAPGASGGERCLLYTSDAADE